MYGPQSQYWERQNIMTSKPTSLGTEEHIAIAISYALGWLSGLIVLLIEKENETVRYHAAQSIIVFGTIHLVQLILPIFLFIGFGLMGILGLLALVLWIVFLVKALSKQPLVLDFVAPYAEKLSGKVN